MSALGVQVKPASLRSFLRACDAAESDVSEQMADTLGRVGEVVRAGAAVRIAAKHGPTAAGYITRVQERGVRVEQGLPKTTGHHPQWGSYQMRRALLPSLRRNSARIRAEFERGTEIVCARFERG